MKFPKQDVFEDAVLSRIEFGLCTPKREGGLWIEDRGSKKNLKRLRESVEFIKAYYLPEDLLEELLNLKRV